YNVAHHNQSPALDGGGFDLDGGVTNSILQYNLSHNNDGYGYLLCQYTGAGDFANNIVRYNISQDDQYGICVAAGSPNVSGMDIYNNTIYNSTGYAIGLFRWGSGDWSDVDIHNNVFVSTGQIVSGATYRETFQNNLYWSTGAPTNFSVDGYTTLEDWADATGQEKVASVIVGLNADPLLVGMGTTTHTDPLTLSSLAEYQLQTGSPCFNAGMVIPDNGGYDLWGNVVPTRGEPDIGAHEYQNAAPTLTAISALSGAVEDQDFTITYAALAAAADEADPDGDTVSFRVESVTSGTLKKGGAWVVPGTTLLGPGESLVWHPAADANGTLAAFTVKAWDGQAASDSPVQVSAEVAPVNDAPQAQADAYAVAEDGVLNVNAASGVLDNDDDVDGDTLSASLVSGTSSGDLTLNADGSFSYAPDEDFNGADSFAYVANDAGADSNEATVTITVNPVNDSPTALPQGAFTLLGTPVNIVLSGTDLETNPLDLVFAIAADPDHGSVTLNGSVARYTPDPGWWGPDTFRFRVTDSGDPAGSHANPGDLSSTSAIVTIDVAPHRYMGTITGPGGVAVHVYDCDGTDDVDVSDVVVKFGDAGAILSIQLTGYQAMHGVGFIVSGATSVGAIKDARRGVKGEVAFIASDAPIKSIQLKSGMSGHYLNGRTLSGVVFPADIDGDGDTDDATALYCEGAIQIGKLESACEGDIWLGGTDAKGMSLKSLSIKHGGFHGDLVAPGDVGKVGLGGDFGSGMDIGGSLKSLQIKGGHLAGIISVTGAVGKISVRGQKLWTGEMLGGSVTDTASIAIYGKDTKGLSLKSLDTKGGGFHGSLMASWGVGKIGVAGDFASSIDVGGALKGLQIKGGDFGGELQVGGELGKLEVKGGKAGGGVFLAGASATVDGLLKSAKVGSYQTNNGGEDFGIWMGSCGKAQVGDWKLGPLSLPWEDGDFCVELI
ncbi:MAG: Ig-like domain-containing protein, partial [Planctomycetota bacterium]